MPIETLTLSELVSRVGEGDREAWIEFFGTRKGRLGRKLRWMAHRASLPHEDLRSDAYEEWPPGSPFWRTLSGKPEPVVRSYVATSLLNLTRGIAKKARQRVVTVPLDTIPERLAADNTLRLALLDYALTRLAETDPRCAALIRRYDVGGEKLKDIAACYGVSEGRASQVRGSNLDHLRDLILKLDPNFR